MKFLYGEYIYKLGTKFSQDVYAQCRRGKLTYLIFQRVHYLYRIPFYPKCRYAVIKCDQCDYTEETRNFIKLEKMVSDKKSEIYPLLENVYSFKMPLKCVAGSILFLFFFIIGVITQ